MAVNRWIAAALAAALLPACGGGGGGGDNLKVVLRGQSAPGRAARAVVACTAVRITVGRVRVHASPDALPADAGWLECPLAARMPVDLLGLGGEALELCSTELPLGPYRQVLLDLVPNGGAAPFANSLVTAAGEEFPLELPSPELPVPIGFLVARNAAVEVTLSIDAATSVHTRGTGTYTFRPVVRPGATTVYRASAPPASVGP